MNIPDDRQYTAEHEWILAAGGDARVGITEYAADRLGDVVFLSLPEVGASVELGQQCGEIESTKSVSELFAPADGTVLEVNQQAVDSPEIVNTDPYGEGWLFSIRVTRSGDLMDAAGYSRLVREAEL